MFRDWADFSPVLSNFSRIVADPLPPSLRNSRIQQIAAGRGVAWRFSGQLAQPTRIT
jgi:hypothetical protein